MSIKIKLNALERLDKEESLKNVRNDSEQIAFRLQGSAE